VEGLQAGADLKRLAEVEAEDVHPLSGDSQSEWNGLLASRMAKECTVAIAAASVATAPAATMQQQQQQQQQQALLAHAAAIGQQQQAVRASVHVG